jgi:phospholipase C
VPNYSASASSATKSPSSPQQSRNVDEGGGYYDSGYVQPLDFFGDGTRIPMIVVSPYPQRHISHSYTDHVSILKFIERNWNLGTISKRSRDNLPNPTPTKGNAYVPSNSPAIGDLWDLFDFSKKVQDNDYPPLTPSVSTAKAKRRAHSPDSALFYVCLILIATTLKRYIFAALTSFSKTT